MFRKLITSGLFAGLAAGAFAALMQLTFVIPLVMEGELYEFGERKHFAEGRIQSLAEVPDIWSEAGRHFTTFASNMVAYTGFALVLVVLMSFAARRGHKITAKTGVVWGLAAFVAVNLAPSFGLPPELPGTANAELVLRQAWWMGTILCTGVALALMAFGRGVWVGVLAIVLLAAPHLYGAPHLDTYYGVAPPELSGLFVARSLGVSAAVWALMGWVAGALWARD